jgi:hypothetical protein
MKRFILSFVFFLPTLVLFSQDSNAPKLESFSFSPTSTLYRDNIKVNFSISVSDAESEIEKIIIEFSPQSGGSSKSETFSKINQSSISLNGEIDFGKNPQIGIWLISIYLEDSEKNKVTLSSGDLAGSGYNSSFEIIENEVVDTTNPELNGFSFTPQEIDLASTNHSVEFSVDVSDDMSGVEEVTVEFSPPGNGSGKTETIRKINSLSASITGTIDFGNNPSTGKWTASIKLKDATGNQITYLSTDLSKMEFPSTIEITEIKDIDPPALIEFTISPDKLDLSNSNTSLQYKISASDILSGLDEIVIIFIPSDNGGVKVEKISKINSALATIYGSIDFKNAKEGRWFIGVQLEDNDGNGVTYTTDELKRRGFCSTFELTKSTDVMPPVLKEFEFSIDAQNSNSDTVYIDFKIKVEDNLSGINEIKVMFDPVENGGGRFVKFSNVSSTSFEYSGKVELKNPPKGDWLVSLALSDKENNEIMMSSTDLEKAGFKAKFTIAETKYLVLVSPVSGDVIELPNKIEIIWESTGIEKINIDLSLDNGATWSKIKDNLIAMNRRHNWEPSINSSYNAILRVSDASDENIFDQHDFQLVKKAITSMEENNAFTQEDILYQNYPNPFNPSTHFSYSLKKESRVLLIVYNMIGEKIAELVNEFQQPGRYLINFDGKGLTSGYYFYQLKTSSSMKSRKMLLIK